MIKLNENYRIEKDTYSWVLVFTEERERKNKKTNELENFEFKEQWYYPDVKQALTKFIDLTCRESETIQELIESMQKVNDIVIELKNTIFKP